MPLSQIKLIICYLFCTGANISTSQAGAQFDHTEPDLQPDAARSRQYARCGSGC